MKLVGSSLLESLVAMVIIVTILTISLNSVVANSSSEKNYFNTKLKYKLIELENSCTVNGNFKSDSKTDSGIDYEVNVELVEGADGLIKVESTASSEEEIIIERVSYYSSSR